MELGNLSTGEVIILIVIWLVVFVATWGRLTVPKRDNQKGAEAIAFIAATLIVGVLSFFLAQG